MRSLLLVVVIVLCSLASAQPRAGEPRAVAPDLLMPAPLRTREVAVTPFRDGYAAAWIDDAAVRMVRLNASGELIDQLPIPLGGTAEAGNLMIASDGSNVLVGWTSAGDRLDGSEASFRIAFVEEGTRHTLTQRVPGSLDGLLYTGTRYLALTGGLTGNASVVALDHRGFTVASTATGLGRDDSDPRTWQSSFFMSGGVAWLVTTYDDRLVRVALTDTSGNLAVAFEPLPIDLPVDGEVLAAGHVRGRWYVVYAGDGQHFIHFLGAGAPIVINGFDEIDGRATRASGGEVYLFGLDHREDSTVVRGVRVTPVRVVWQFEIATGTASWATGSAVAPRGVLLVTANAAPAATPNFAPPLARLIRTLGRHPQPIISPPAILAWAKASQFEVALGAHGEGFLAVWKQPGVDGNEIWSRLLDRDGHALGEPRPIGLGTTPQVASNGEVAAVAWFGKRNVEARLLDSAGFPMGEPIPLDRAADARVIGIGWDGTQFSVAWDNAANVSAVAFSAAGELLSESPVRLSEPRLSTTGVHSFAVSPFGALLVYSERATGETIGVRLNRDLSPAGSPFEIFDVHATHRQAVWTGEHYVVVFTHDRSIRAARVTASGVSLDAPYGVWLGRGFYSHATAYANGRLAAVHPLGGLIADRTFRDVVEFEQPLLPYATGSIAMRDDGAVLIGYSTFTDNRWLAVVRTLE